MTVSAVYFWKRGDFFKEVIGEVMLALMVPGL